MKVETVFILSLLNDYADPKDWSREIGLTPLEVRLKGERVSTHPRAQISPDSYWVFGIERSLEESVEQQIIKVLDQLYSKKKEIINLVKKLGLDVECKTYVWIDNLSDLSITFSNDLLKKMTELGILFTFTRY